MSEHDILILAAAIGAVLVAGRLTARHTPVPEPVALLAFGLLAGLIPFVPTVQVAPDLVFLLFLPPLLYHAAFQTGPREARENSVGVLLLALGATLATTAAVAAALHWLMPSVGWPAAVAFGAAIAPTDAVAATALLDRLGVPDSVGTLLRGESLANDAVALTVFGLAVESLDGLPSLGHGAIRLAAVVLGGPCYGVAVGWVVKHVRQRLPDRGMQVLLSVATPFLAYIPAEQAGSSGVLATVAAGLYLGTRAEGMLPAASRLAGQVFWRVLVFLLESTLFVLLGMQIHELLGRYAGQPAVTVLLGALGGILAALLLVRIVWSLLIPTITPGWVARGSPSWRSRVVIGWSGIRGAITLALALSLPTRIPQRASLILLCAGVVLVTLLMVVPTLPMLVRLLRLAEPQQRQRQERLARLAASEAALRRLEDLVDDGSVDEATADAYRQLLEARVQHAQDQLEARPADPAPAHAGELRRELADAQRERLDQLYREGRINEADRRALVHEAELDRPETRRGLHG